MMVITPEASIVMELAPQVKVMDVVELTVSGPPTVTDFNSPTSSVCARATVVFISPTTVV
ncbi:hypothetical protein VSO28_04420 [Citrobacter werkmanii]|nr:MULTISPECIES: hypothetical protein [Citrobacter]MEC3943611.1 hypothetical protein [Citrobacter werkmanii]